MNEEILAALEQKLAQHNRNQATIDRLKQVTWKDRMMLALPRINWWRAIGFGACVATATITILLFLGVWSLLFAAEMPQCPDVGVKCKVIFLNPQEENMLMIQNGILDTAAQGRALDLGQFAVFLKTKIAAAPQGEVKQPPAPPTTPPKVDSGVPANVTPN
jgi:hypothetical protein